MFLHIRPEQTNIIYIPLDNTPLARPLNLAAMSDLRSGV